MTVLTLDTASPKPAVALIVDGRIFEEALPEDRRASEDLLPAVRRALSAAGLALGDCARIGVCAGPGSFTGLRVGLATAWGLGRAAGIPVEAVSTLAAIAEAARVPGRRRVVAALDAGRGDLVAERFDLGGSRARSIAPRQLLRSEDLASFAGDDPVEAMTAAEAPESGARTPAAALAEAISRQPGEEAGSDPRLGLPAIYSRPSAAEEKHGAA